MAFHLAIPDDVAKQVIIFFLVISLVGFIFSSRSKTADGEPPSAPTNVPLVGHVLGLMRDPVGYYVQLSRKVRSPIFTLTLPGQKMYIVTSSELIQAVQKQPKVLAFPPLEAKFANLIADPSPEGQKILVDSVQNHESGLSVESYEDMRFALKPGPGLDQMNRVMVRNIADSLDSLLHGGEVSKKLSLYDWLRDVVTVATTNSVYGAQNPFQNASIVKGFWEYERRLLTLLFGFLPSLTARKAIAGREVVAKAFEDYYKRSGHEKASALTEKHYDVAARHGVSQADTARFEAVNVLALLVNTIPATFWMLYLMYAHPGLLTDIREEIGRVAEERHEDGEALMILDITKVKTGCPLLTSSFQEMLRFRGIGTSVREVVEDTMLDGRWKLRKGGMIQMPSRVTHTDPSVWGPNANSFEPRRFMKGTHNAKSAPASAFRAFGGGATLCPGRHFATNEILAVVSMFVMRYDLGPVSGSWELPSADKTSAASVVMEPDADVDVIVTRRRGYETPRWSFGLENSEDIFAFVAEDLVSPVETKM